VDFTPARNEKRNFTPSTFGTLVSVLWRGKPRRHVSVITAHAKTRQKLLLKGDNNEKYFCIPLELLYKSLYFGQVSVPVFIFQCFGNSPVSQMFAYNVEVIRHKTRY